MKSVEDNDRIYTLQCFLEYSITLRRVLLVGPMTIAIAKMLEIGAISDDYRFSLCRRYGNARW